ATKYQVLAERYEAAALWRRASASSGDWASASAGNSSSAGKQRIVSIVKGGRAGPAGPAEPPESVRENCGSLSACKPVSVSAAETAAAIIRLGPPFPTASSNLPGTPSAAGRRIVPYLVLLHAGLGLPFESPRTRRA